MEIWKEFKKHYEVSNSGRIKSLPRHVNNRFSGYITKEKFLIITTNKLGYSCITLNGHGYTIHRLVAEAFIPNPLGLKEVNHCNGDKTDNRAGNLEWCTRSDNMLHAFKNKLKKAKIGETHVMSKLNENQVREIRELKDNISQRNLAKKYGVSQRLIFAIHHNTTWKHLQ